MGPSNVFKQTPEDRTVIGAQSIGSQRNAAREKLLLCENRASGSRRRFDTN